MRLSSLSLLSPTARLGLSLFAVALLLMAVTQVNSQLLSPWLVTRVEVEPTDDGRQYRLMVAAIRAPARVRRLWDLRVGDAMDALGLWAYYDGYAMYLRFGIHWVKPGAIGCLVEDASNGRVVPLPCD